MRVAVLCATQRGYAVLKRLTELLPDSELVVFTFKEETFEPPFFEDIQSFTRQIRGQFFEAKKVGDGDWLNFWETTTIDVLFSVSWRYLIPEAVYKRPRLGTFIFHDSMLPEYRGFAPTVWAMINGEDHTGATIFHVTKDVDSGDLVDQQLVAIADNDTIAQVMERVTSAYIDLLERNLPSIMEGRPQRLRQNSYRATYTCKRLPEDNLIDWSSSSKNIYNLIRAVSSPYTGAFTFLKGQRLVVWSASEHGKHHSYIGRVPGRVVEIDRGKGVVVLTGDGQLLLDKVQLEGHSIAEASEILNNLSYTLGR